MARRKVEIESVPVQSTGKRKVELGRVGQGTLPSGLSPHPPSPEPSLISRAFLSTREGVRALGDFLATKEGQRLALEAGVATVATVVAPQFGGPATMVRGLRGLNLGARMFASGAGMAAGSLAAEGFDPGERPLKAAADSFFLGAFAEASGSAIIAGGGKAIAPLKGKLEAGAEKASALIREAGGILLPGQASTSRVVDILQNIAEASLFGGGKITKVKQATSALVQKTLDDFVGTFSKVMTKEDIGDLARLAIEDSSSAYRAFTRSIARFVDDAAGGIRVDIRPAKVFAQKIIDQSGKGIKSPNTIKVARSVIDKDDFIAFEGADILRSDLLAVGRVGTDIMPGKAQGAANKLASLVDDGISGAGKSLQRDEAISAWRVRNQVVREGRPMFNNRLFRSLGAKDADEVVQSIIKAGKPTRIRKARQIILGEIPLAEKGVQLAGVTVKPKLPSEPALWQAIQGSWLDDLMRGSAELGGEVSGKKVLQGLKKFGDEALEELFPGGEAATVREIAEALAFSQRAATSEGTGKIFIQLAQAGATVNLVASAFTDVALQGMSAAIVLGPPLIARMFTNKTIAKWLTVGLKAPPGSKLAVKASAEIIAAMDKQGILPAEISLLRRAKQAKELTERLRNN